LVNGARQSGKSTLLRQISRTDASEWRDLDLPLIRQAAVADPIGFVDYPGMMVIDEIQRVPELLLPIKVQVDGDPRAGRYLLSGSGPRLGAPRAAGHAARTDGNNRTLAFLSRRDRRSA
jgi:hypothetical protein